VLLLFIALLTLIDKFFSASQHEIHHARQLFVLITVVLELEWVLRSRCKQTMLEFIGVMSALLTMVAFSFESEGALEQALVDYEEGSADFGEYIHLALSRAGKALPFWTFDRKVAKAQGAEMLR
jgi:predicted nucleic-acid-binding protein